MSEVKKTRQKRKKSPVHDVVIRAFRFSIDTSESDSKKLFNIFGYSGTRSNHRSE